MLSMETSTPISLEHAENLRFNFSPRQTPLRNNRQSLLTDELDQFSDNIERAERQKNAAIRKSLAVLPHDVTGSPNVNDSIRRLTEEDLRSQLQIITKLHAENKISVKNVWTLRIIDILKQFVNKGEEDVLKVAGGSLEIAGKVYGLRVDDLHSEGLKLAGSLARNFASKQVDEEPEENRDPNVPEGENKKKKRQAKKKRLLMGGDKKLTVNAEPKAFQGTLPRLESAAFSARTDTAMSATGNLFTNKVRVDPSGYKFMFSTKEKIWGWAPGNDQAVKMDTNKTFAVAAKSVRYFKMCAPFKDFKVDMWDPDENIELLRKHSVIDDVVLDAEGIPIPELDGSIHDVFEEMHSESLNAGDAMEEEIVVPHNRQEVEQIADFRPTEQGVSNSLEKSAYSFNTLIVTGSGKIDQIWAGPAHWKFKHVRGNGMVYSGSDRDEQKEEDQKKKKALKRKREVPQIDLWDLEPSKVFTVNAKKNTRRKRGLDPDKVRQPVKDIWGLKIVDRFPGIMLLPAMKVAAKNRITQISVPEISQNANVNIEENCPQPLEDNDNGADLGDDLFDTSNRMDDNPIAQDDQASGFMGNNLVDAPYMVQETHMHYATKAKKIDMKKLKYAMWCTLTRTKEYDPSAKVIPTSFSEVYQEVRRILPEKMTAELTCPVAFAALLHLCNEQNLALNRREADISDFDIVGPEC